MCTKQNSYRPRGCLRSLSIGRPPRVEHATAAGPLGLPSWAAGPGSYELMRLSFHKVLVPPVPGLIRTGGAAAKGRGGARRPERLPKRGYDPKFSAWMACFLISWRGACCATRSASGRGGTTRTVPTCKISRNISSVYHRTICVPWLPFFFFEFLDHSVSPTFWLTPFHYISDLFPTNMTLHLFRCHLSLLFLGTLQQIQSFERLLFSGVFRYMNKGFHLYQRRPTTVGNKQCRSIFDVEPGDKRKELKAAKRPGKGRSSLPKLGDHLKN